MNVRLKSANKEQSTCSNKMSEISSDQERREEVEVDEEDKPSESVDTIITKTSKEINVETNQQESDKNESTTSPSQLKEDQSESSTDEKEEEQASKSSLPEHGNNDEQTENSPDHKDVKDTKTDEEHEQKDSPDLSKSEETNSKYIKDKDDSPCSSDESDHEKSNISSKLDAEALSASLSSSKCLLKRNRDDLDSDNDDDSGGEKEEPYSKKTHIGEVTPKHVSKLKSSELLASMSSSKSLLKRGIEKVDKANTEEAADAPESKKSNLAQTHKPEESPEKSKEEIKLTPRKEVESPEENKPFALKVAAKTLKFPMSPICQNAEPKGSISRSPKEPEKPTSYKKEEPVKEEVQQKIGAKELAGQRQLDRKRLNKMLAIFDDQKIVK